uniref:Secreted protein n=1 Tax=Amblyomma triste TaxID=251400 RepID=A0A023G1N6_AMBTT
MYLLLSLFILLFHHHIFASLLLCKFNLLHSKYHIKSSTTVSIYHNHFLTSFFHSVSIIASNISLAYTLHSCHYPNLSFHEFIFNYCATYFILNTI